MLSRQLIREIVSRALDEDLRYGDITTEAVVSPEAKGTGCIFAREAGVIAGLPLAEQVFLALDESLDCSSLIDEGDRVAAGEAVMRISGSLQSLLSGERTALNFLQRLSGIATLTAAWTEAIRDFPARLTDTRKTTPGLRALEKYAVRVGGGVNHRFSLDSGILIKDNHISAAGSVAAAIDSVRARGPLVWRIEVEVTDLEELREALDGGAEIIMLDNMELPLIEEAVGITAGRALLEASGNITLERLREVAATGVDYISSGALTHSYRSLNLSLLLEQ